MLILDLVRLRPQAFRHAAESPRAPLWMAAFLLGTGAAYGALLSGFQRALGVAFQGVPAAEVPTWVLLAANLVSGELIALVFHGGVTLLVWLMAKGIGGPGGLGLLYRATAYVLPLALPALPALALDAAARGAVGGSSLPGAGALTALAWLGAALVLAGLYQLLRVTQDASPAKSAAAVAVFAFFCSSFLLL
ncbi:MAG: hypothetical protein ACYDA8_17335 [Deferrisomatales bacterium]